MSTPGTEPSFAAPNAPATGNHEDILAFARSVVEIEARALDALSESLGAPFLEAVELLLATNGRVIVSGMGKSGHVGRKIAATLASTGTAAHFVHPAEASHGDLGMVVPGDTMIILSNSGETAELVPLLGHAKRIGVRVIGVASQANSLLLRSADVALLLPPLPEACPVGLAPTTSTTATLGLGDALAMAVMRARSFSREQFRFLHPGGKIGLRLMQVADLMHAGSALPLVREDTPMVDVIITITEKSFGIAGVVDEAGRLVGSITDGDLRRNADRLQAASARDVMNPAPRHIPSSTFAEDALRFMHESRIMALFIVDDERTPIGLVHVHDFLRAGLTA